MKITAVETLRFAGFAENQLWLQVRTDEGPIGLGETFYNPATVAAYIHEVAAPYLIGKDPLAIDRHSRHLNGYLGFSTTSAEMRGNSAVDLALWDIFGQSVGKPIWQLLGGLSRDRVRVYNTCAGYAYGSKRMEHVAETEAGRQTGGPYEDLDAFMNRADELAQSLLEEGVTAMKIWPFDPYLTGNLTMHLDPADLDRGLEPFRKIRKAVGNRIDVMLEFNNAFNLPTALRIARAVEEFNPYWYEDPIRADDLGALGEFAKGTRIPLASTETLGTRWAFRDLLERRIPQIVILDLSWTGGLSEAKKIASMAEAYQLPVAPHDCTGPVVLAASIHLSLNAPNAMIQEMVRAYYTGWYREVVTELPRIERGYAYPTTKPGLGLALQPDLARRPGAIHQRTDRPS
jgi:L-alanine-DL-glutamate epimerase-like enolase superfamily enzyme